MKTRLVGRMAMAMALASTGIAQASTVFEGRSASGAVDTSCTASGANKCTMFYDKTLDITILNDWYIGIGMWGNSGVFVSAQDVAKNAGYRATGLTGWVLPTGQGGQSGANNQFRSIWDDAGGTFAGLHAQFDVGSPGVYWSGSEYMPNSRYGWYFSTHDALQIVVPGDYVLYALAVRPGDVAAVPEPQTYATLLAGLGLLGFVARRRSKQQ